MTNKAKKPAKAAAAKAATAKSTAHKAKPTPAPAGPNPLLERWTTPFEVPPFDKVRTEHFLPAIEKGFADGGDEHFLKDPNAEGNHGRSASRQYWGTTGLGTSAVGSCNTFTAPKSQVR